MKLTDWKYLQVTTSIYNLILGKLYCDHYGTMRIQGNREYSCKLKFKEQSIIDRNPHQVICILFCNTMVLFCQHVRFSPQFLSSVHSFTICFFSKQFCSEDCMGTGFESTGNCSV